MLRFHEPVCRVSAVATSLTNQEFGERIGVGHSMASRIRSGQRLPSVAVMKRISEEFDLPLETLVLRHEQGPEAFGKLIRSTLELRGRVAA